VISYKFDNDGILKVVFEGRIVYNDIIDWLVQFSEIANLPRQINLLYDFRKAILLIDAVKLIQIAKKTEEATKNFERVRTAFLIDESAQSTYSMLFSFLDIKGKTTRKIFTDLKKAVDWISSETS
jgi:hypothetical protein